MVGIIGAMPEEVQGLVDGMNIHAEKDCANGLHIFEGTLSGKECMVARCGIGKVFAAMAAQTLITMGADSIINVGVGGAIAEKLKVFDIVIADKVFQHDLDLSPIGFSLGTSPDFTGIYVDADKMIARGLSDSCKELNLSRHFIGTVATGDQFSTHAIKAKIMANFEDTIAIDMESGAIGQVCSANHIPFGILRIISNPEGASDDFWNFKDQACTYLLQILGKYLDRFV